MASFHETTRKYFNSNNRIRELQAHSAKVHSVAWNSDGKRLASGSYDKTVNVFVLDRERMVGLLLKQIRTHIERSQTLSRHYF